MPGYPSKVYRQTLVVLTSTSDPSAYCAEPAAAHEEAVGVKIRRLQSGSISLAVPQTEVIIFAGPMSSTVPVILASELAHDYRELGEALNELRDLDADDEWKIDAPVYHAACFVAAELMANNFSVPRVFAHGPHSVVFNWHNGLDNLYLTVSADRMSALISSPERIKRRIDYSASDLIDPAFTLSSIRAAYLEHPIQRVITASTTDSLEPVG